MVLIDVESENGWRPPDLRPGAALLVWKTIPGTENNEDGPVNIQVMAGLPEVFLPAWVADWNAYIEPVRDRDTCSYTNGNSVYTSNHKNGTAVDVNWDDNPFQQDTWPEAQKATVHEMVDFYEGWVFWAGDWQSPLDQMHSQMGYNTWNRNTAAIDFIARKIRSDGTSTFRRGPLSKTDPPQQGNEPAAPTPDTPDNPSRDNVDGVDSAVKVLYDAVPDFDMDDAARMAPLIISALALSECTNASRIAMWLAQIGWESGGFVYTQEIQPPPGAAYPPYIGRTWIQITWQSNYADFGEWCVEQGLLSDANYFVNNPVALADDKWAAIGPAWYWTVQRPQINKLCDAGDLLNVTKEINGGTNGLDDPGGRRDRYNQAIALGDRLLLLTKQDNEQEGDITLPDTVTRAEWDSLVNDVKEIRAQLDGDWPQNSNDPKAAADLDKRKANGDRLTVNDLIVWLKNHVSTHAKPTP